MRAGWGWLLADELCQGEEGRFVVGVEVRRRADDFLGPGYRGPRPALVHDWLERDGQGWVRNLLPGEQELVTTCSRYVEADGRFPRGLFIGGRPPLLPGNEGTRVLNQSGMAYYDGRRWYHIWCNANKGLAYGEGEHAVSSVDWQYDGGDSEAVGGRVLRLTSDHWVELPEGRINTERRALFRAGDPFVVLALTFVNPGSEAVMIRYGYGDESWLGEYGSSEGNVGWVGDRLILYEEELDPVRERSAGYFDYGNEALGAARIFTNVANFFEWHPSTGPTAAYFSNGVGQRPAPGGGGCAVRGGARPHPGVGPVLLRPGATARVLLAVGMAEPGAVGRLPRRPVVDWPYAEVAFFARELR